MSTSGESPATKAQGTGSHIHGTSVPGEATPHQSVKRPLEGEHNGGELAGGPEPNREVDTEGMPAEKKQRLVPTEGVLEVHSLVSNKESGVIIGRQGANITQIREESCTFINILKNDNPGAQERVVKVKGDVHGVTKGYQLITSLLSQESTEKDVQAIDTQSSDVKIADKVVFNFLIHFQQCGAIIGKSGSVIKSIQDETKCRIQLSNEVLDGSTDKKVTLSGSLESVHLAIQQIIPRLAESPLKPGTPVHQYKPGRPAFAGPAGYAAPYQGNPYGYGGAVRGSYSGGYGGASYGHQGGFHQPYGAPAPPSPRPLAGTRATEGSVPFPIPTSAAGAVIGKGGSVIMNIKAQSGCHITIDDPDPADPSQRIVNISGPPKGVETAKYLIQQRVDAPTSGGMTMAGGEASERMAIPSAAAGSVIGRQGTVIADIKQQSGCHIRISDSDPSSAERYVTISGHPSGIKTAVDMIKYIVDQNAQGQPSYPSGAAGRSAAHSSYGSYQQPQAAYGAGYGANHGGSYSAHSQTSAYGMQQQYASGGYDQSAYSGYGPGGYQGSYGQSSGQGSASSGYSVKPY